MRWNYGAKLEVKTQEIIKKENVKKV